VNVIAQVIETREDGRQDSDAADDRWLATTAGVDPEERREKWRRWLRRELERSLQWPKNEAARDRLIGQCAGEITVLARQLRGRGWLLEGTALAVHVRALLAPIAKAQKAGKVRDFWPYFGEAVSRYVGANAEEIQAHARRTGAEEGAQTMAGALAAFGLGGTAKKAASLTEIVAERDAQIRKEKAAKAAADAAQMRLL
jgi:hypothetical protein